MTLVVGSEEKAIRIKVSSKVLSLSSHVFLALLGPSFAEGTNLANTGQVEVSLPDEDIEAMIWICKILHHQLDVDVNPEQTTLAFLQKVATLCDKYDLATALKGWSAYCLYVWLENAQVDYHYSKLLPISYVFENQIAFYECSKRLLMACSIQSSYVLGEEDVLFDFLPKRVLSKCSVAERDLWLTFIEDSLHMERVRLAHEVQNGIDNCISPYVKTFHQQNANTIAHFYGSLTRAGLWPTACVIDKSTLAELVERLRKTQPCTLLIDRVTSCLCSQICLHGIIHKIADKVERDLVGLCLVCAKHGKFTRSEGNCLQRSRCLNPVPAS